MREAKRSITLHRVFPATLSVVSEDLRLDGSAHFPGSVRGHLATEGSDPGCSLPAVIMPLCSLQKPLPYCTSWGSQNNPTPLARETEALGTERLVQAHEWLSPDLNPGFLVLWLHYLSLRGSSALNLCWNPRSPLYPA